MNQKPEKKAFHFDNVIDSRDPEQNQVSTANLIVPLVFEALNKGVSTVIMASGQTSSGKTFTMSGQPGQVGLIPRIGKRLFDEGFEVYSQYVEIYNQKLFDLYENDPHLLFKTEERQFNLNTTLKQSRKI